MLSSIYTEVPEHVACARQCIQMPSLERWTTFYAPREAASQQGEWHPSKSHYTKNETPATIIIEEMCKELGRGRRLLCWSGHGAFPEEFPINWEAGRRWQSGQEREALLEGKAYGHISRAGMGQSWGGQVGDDYACTAALPSVCPEEIHCSSSQGPFSASHPPLAQSKDSSCPSLSMPEFFSHLLHSFRVSSSAWLQRGVHSSWMLLSHRSLSPVNNPLRILRFLLVRNRWEWQCAGNIWLT